MGTLKQIESPRAVYQKPISCSAGAECGDGKIKGAKLLIRRLFLLLLLSYFLPTDNRTRVWNYVEQGIDSPFAQLQRLW